MAKHTPGPWHIEAGTHYRAIRTDGEVIANMREIGGCFNDGNARLMAAAPELLESLQQTIASLEHWFVRHGDPEGVNSLMMKKARAAIAKATGD